MSSILFEIRDAIGIITLNRPDKLNAFNREMALLMQEKLDDLGALGRDWTDSCRSYVRERPLTAIGVAVLAGLLLSRWIRT